LVPLIPYIAIDHAGIALKVSALVTSVTLFGFGYIKGSFTGAKPWKSAVQTTLIGGLAATAAFAIAQIFH
jgi:vacuolar iron transporter family protein